MQKKLSPEKLDEILETGIAEFAEHGLERSNINIIAKKAGISVGVLYKYYKNKDNFFLACLDRSLTILNEALSAVSNNNDKPFVRSKKIAKAVLNSSREHGNYIKMYHEITVSNNHRFASILAEKIEGISSKIYVDYIRDAQSKGLLRTDISPEMAAFFFDNLLMMMQFSYSCEYYQERFKMYCGDNIMEQDDFVVSEFLKFIESAFTFKSSEIKHTQ